ncbi:predicted protein [Sclerotinia sclerotiorum 1980 UF-70]|uniref:Uncharacterized protein n=1 Tax=Sclerotinia sclerotiorum (strain ATCC 18683 / 1980 / Ss-1) TaxID=665079 RepID=A7EWS0_SCLS1|nr:predicted protein [Sclerotinia sclerotiorum 1980 UF-70]EDN93912.1 predicted protein [Sclerotinia sclerotiorum 1980 UF-70]
MIHLNPKNRVPILAFTFYEQKAPRIEETLIHPSVTNHD